MERSAPSSRADPVSGISSEETVVKTEGDSDSKTVKITVQKEGSKDVSFLFKRNAPLKKLMDHYCLNMGFDDKSLKFTYLGTQVKDHQTPLDLRMDPEDVIDCWADQTGGRGRVRVRCRN